MCFLVREAFWYIDSLLLFSGYTVSSNISIPLQLSAFNMPFMLWKSCNYKFRFIFTLGKTQCTILEGSAKSNKLCITELDFRGDEHDLALDPADKRQISMFYLLHRKTWPSVHGFSFLIKTVVPGQANVSENTGIHHSIWQHNDTWVQQCQQGGIHFLDIHAVIIWVY